MGICICVCLGVYGGACMLGCEGISGCIYVGWGVGVCVVCCVYVRVRLVHMHGYAKNVSVCVWGELGCMWGI